MIYLTVLQILVLVLAGVSTIAAARQSQWPQAASWAIGWILFWGLAPWQCGTIHIYPGIATCHSPAGLSASVHAGTDPFAKLIGGDLMLLASSRLGLVGLLGLVGAVTAGRRLAGRHP